MSSDETMTAGATAESAAAPAPASSPEGASSKSARTRRPRATKKTEAAADPAAAAPGDSGSDSAQPAGEAPAEKPARAKRASRTRKSAAATAAESDVVASAAAKGGASGAGDAADAGTVAKAAAKSAAASGNADGGSEDGAAASAPEAASEDSSASSRDVKPGRAGRAPRSRSSRSAKPAVADEAEATATSAASSQGDSAVAPDANEYASKGESKSDSDKAESPKAESAKGEAGRQEKSERFEKANRQDRQDRNGRNGKNGKQQRDQRSNQRQGQNQDHRRQRRSHMGGNSNREPVVPKTTAEDLNALKVAELRAKADELGVESKGLKKAELVERVLEASVRAEGFIEVAGVLDIMQDGYGFLRTGGYLPGENDVYVGLSLIRRNGLRKGDYIRGQIRPKRDNEKFAALQQIATVNDVPFEQLGQRVRFGDLTPIYPDECLLMEHGKTTITARVIDLVAPIGKGQRGLIVSPPKAGKTTILKDIAAAITANNPEVHLMCLLVDERPEEVTDMERSIKGEVISSTFDMPTENHITVAELVIERAKRLVECGKDVVILLDSLTRLARAYNLAQPASGRILSGGVDSTALYPPKRFLGAARNIEGGGSLTILASALIETGSKMDEVIFEEFKGTGNMELKLDRYLADRRIFPAIDPVASGTRKEDLLLNPQEAPLIWAVRRILSNMNNTERAMDMLIKSLKQTSTNQEFLLRTAKKAQTSRDSDNFEF